MGYGQTQKPVTVTKITEEQQRAQEQQLIAYVEEQLSVDKQTLMARFPFTGSVISRLETVVGHWDWVYTACTDGDKIWMDVLFYVKLDPDEKLFVLAHECWHVIMRHFLRKMNRNDELYNWATDLEIHFLLTKEGLKPPFVLPHDPEWKDLSAEEIYERLLGWEKQNDNNNHSDDGGSGDDGGSNERKIPKHWKQGVESKNLRSPGLGCGFDSHDVKRNDESNDTEDEEDPREVEERIAEKIKSAAEFAKKRNRGVLPAHIEALVDSLPEPKIPWQQVLRQFVTQSIGGSRQWIPPNRRYVWRGMYAQSTKQSTFRGVVALDTSGSCSELLPRFFGELVGLLNSFGKYELTVIWCDCEIQRVETYSDDINPPYDKSSWRMYGGGGTSHVPVFDWIRREYEDTPNVVICLTDLYTEFPKTTPSYPVLWVVPEEYENDLTTEQLPWGQLLVLD